MNKTMKIISTLLIAIMLVMTVSNVVLGASDIIGNVKDQTKLGNAGDSSITELAGKIIAFLQYAAIIGGVIIITVLGIKYMMGSLEEKAEYKKSMIPLIVGIIVVMSASTIANLLFKTFVLQASK